MAQNVAGGHQQYAPSTVFNMLDFLKNGDFEKWVEHYHLLGRGAGTYTQAWPEHNH